MGDLCEIPAVTMPQAKWWKATGLALNLGVPKLWHQNSPCNCHVHQLWWKGCDWYNVNQPFWDSIFPHWPPQHYTRDSVESFSRSTKKYKEIFSLRCTFLDFIYCRTINGIGCSSTWLAWSMKQNCNYLRWFNLDLLRNNSLKNFIAWNRLRFDLL